MKTHSYPQNITVGSKKPPLYQTHTRELLQTAISKTEIPMTKNAQRFHNLPTVENFFSINIKPSKTSSIHQICRFRETVKNENKEGKKTGGEPTWARGTSTATFKRDRLDRALYNPEWRFLFEIAKVIHLPKLNSDHSPLPIRLREKRILPSNTKFRFQGAWLTHPGLQKVVRDHRSNNLLLHENIPVMYVALDLWNKHHFGNIFQWKIRLWARLAGVQKQLSIQNSQKMLKMEKKLQQELETILNLEEIFWYKKSREKWITSGDRNTKFYHASTLVRKSRNRIEALRDSTGEWITEQSILEKMVLDYFHNLFSAEDKEQSMADIPREFPNLSCNQKIKLTKPFSKEEVKIAIFEMSPFKALGANGIHAGFYQNLWEVVGDSVCNFSMRFFETGSLPHGVNDTILDLVPKVLHPETLTQLRPISLCNVGYKAMTKTITNRLKELMGSIIAPSQSSFVPGSNI